MKAKANFNELSTESDNKGRQKLLRYFCLIEIGFLCKFVMKAKANFNVLSSEWPYLIFAIANFNQNV